MIEQLILLFNTLRDFYKSLNTPQKIVFSIILFFAILFYNMEKIEPYIIRIYTHYEAKQIEQNRVNNPIPEDVDEENIIHPAPTITSQDKSIPDLEGDYYFRKMPDIKLIKLNEDDSNKVTNILKKNGLDLFQVKRITLNEFYPHNEDILSYQGYYYVYSKYFNLDDSLLVYSKKADAEFYKYDLVPILSSYKQMEYILKNKITISKINKLFDATKTFYVWDNKVDLSSETTERTITNDSVFHIFDINYVITIPIVYGGKVVGFMNIFLHMKEFPENELINNIVTRASKSLVSILPILSSIERR